MRPEEIRRGAYYRGSDGNIRLASQFTGWPCRKYVWWLNSFGRPGRITRERGLTSDFAAWAHEEVAPTWSPVSHGPPHRWHPGLYIRCRDCQVRRTAGNADEICLKGVLDK